MEHTKLIMAETKPGEWFMTEQIKYPKWKRKQVKDLVGDKEITDVWAYDKVKAVIYNTEETQKFSKEEFEELENMGVTLFEFEHDGYWNRVVAQFDVYIITAEFGRTLHRVN